MPVSVLLVENYLLQNCKEQVFFYLVLGSVIKIPKRIATPQCNLSFNTKLASCGSFSTRAYEACWHK